MLPYVCLSEKSISLNTALQSYLLTWSARFSDDIACSGTVQLFWDYIGVSGILPVRLRSLRDSLTGAIRVYTYANLNVLLMRRLRVVYERDAVLGDVCSSLPEALHDQVHRRALADVRGLRTSAQRRSRGLSAQRHPVLLGTRGAMLWF